MEEIQKMVWPGWTTTRLIGRGSFSSVYEIRRENAGKMEIAAMKVISIPQNSSQIDALYSDGYDQESIAAMYQNQLKRILAKCALMKKTNGSAHIVNCEDVCYAQHEDGIGWNIFIKMELLTPMMKVLPETVVEETVIQLAMDLCSALEVCHQQGIVHRDIKPQNIFIAPGGVFKLGDLGISKTAEKNASSLKGSANNCIAPEVYQTHTYSSSTDIYALGMVLYWMLNERRMPFLPLPPAQIQIGMNEEARARRLSGEPFPLPKNGSKALQKIVMKACAFAAEARYSSVAEIKRDLEALRQNIHVVPQIAEEPLPVAEVEQVVFAQPVEPVVAAAPVYDAAPAASAAPVKPVNKGKKTGWIAAAAICLVLLAAAVGAYFLLKPADKVAEEAPVEEVQTEDPWVLVATYIVMEDGAERLSKAYQYDAQGNLIETTSYSADGEVSGWSESTFDEKGNIIKKIWYSRDSAVLEWYTYVYDAEGNEISGYCYNADDTLRSWYSYEYDSYGNWTTYIGHGADGAISNTYSNVYEYDSNGKLTKQSSLDKKGNVTGWGEYDYDSSGNQAKYTWFLADGTISAWRKYAYDANGNLLLNEKHLPDGTVTEKLENEYDVNGNLLFAISYGADQTIIQQTRYEYVKLSEALALQNG